MKINQFFSKSGTLAYICQANAFRSPMGGTYLNYFYQLLKRVAHYMPQPCNSISPPGWCYRYTVTS